MAEEGDGDARYLYKNKKLLNKIIRWPKQIRFWNTKNTHRFDRILQTDSILNSIASSVEHPGSMDMIFFSDELSGFVKKV